MYFSWKDLQREGDRKILHPLPFHEIWVLTPGVLLHQGSEFTGIPGTLSRESFLGFILRDSDRVFLGWCQGLGFVTAPGDAAEPGWAGCCGVSESVQTLKRRVGSLGFRFMPECFVVPCDIIMNSKLCFVILSLEANIGFSQIRKVWYVLVLSLVLLYEP